MIMVYKLIAQAARTEATVLIWARAAQVRNWWRALFMISASAVRGRS